MQATMQYDSGLCVELFNAWLRRCKASDCSSEVMGFLEAGANRNTNEVQELLTSAIGEFHTRYKDGEISCAEFGTIVDILLSW